MKPILCASPSALHRFIRRTMGGLLRRVHGPRSAVSAGLLGSLCAMMMLAPQSRCFAEGSGNNADKGVAPPHAASPGSTPVPHVSMYLSPSSYLTASFYRHVLKGKPVERLVADGRLDVHLYVARRFDLTAALLAGCTPIGERAFLFLALEHQDEWAFDKKGASTLLTLSGSAGLSRGAAVDCIQRIPTSDAILKETASLAEKLGAFPSPIVFIDGRRVTDWAPVAEALKTD